MFMTLQRFALLADTQINLLPVDRHVPGRIDSQSYLTAVDPKDGDDDVTADDHALANAPGQYEHLKSPA